MTGGDVSALTWQISLRAESAPIEKSVPGILLLMVAGMTTIGMRKAGYLSRFSDMVRTLW